jgi:hypothetical protein
MWSLAREKKEHQYYCCYAYSPKELLSKYKSNHPQKKNNSNLQSSFLQISTYVMQCSLFLSPSFLFF